MTCNKCGSPVQEGDSFCQSCGAKLNDTQNSFNQQNTQNDFNQNQQYNNGYNQNQQYNSNYSQNGFNQNQQYNNNHTQNGFNQNQQYNSNYSQNGFNQNQQYNNGYNQGGFYPKAPITNRNIVTCILLSIITCGIYSIIWYIGMVDDLNLVSEEPNPTSGGMVFLLGLITCNIYNLYWMYKAGELMNQAKYKRGMMTDNNSGILYLVLSLFGLGIVSYCLIQNDLNKMADM